VLVRKPRRCIQPTAIVDVVGRFHILDAADTPQVEGVVAAVGNIPSIGHVVRRSVAHTPDEQLPPAAPHRERPGVEAAVPSLRRRSRCFPPRLHRQGSTRTPLHPQKQRGPEDIPEARGEELREEEGAARSVPVAGPWRRGW